MAAHSVDGAMAEALGHLNRISCHVSGYYTEGYRVGRGEAES